MHFQASRKYALITVFIGLISLEILDFSGILLRDMFPPGARLALVLGYLAMMGWEFARRGKARRKEGSRPALEVDGKNLATLYHEIQNCTSTLKGNAYLLKQNLTCEKERVSVERIERAAASIERIAREVMVHSDPVRLEPAVKLDLPMLIQECVEDHFPAGSRAFHFECTGAPSEIIGDPGKLRQAFVNLFKNSFEADAAHIRIRLAPAGRYLHILIEDDGRGCPYEDLKRIFLPMQTTKREKGGMGIGLALVKAIVEGHGGKIWASARKGPRTRGLAIHITLPVGTRLPRGVKVEGGRPEVLAA